VRRASRFTLDTPQNAAAGNNIIKLLPGLFSADKMSLKKTKQNKDGQVRIT
jgi:hypothetical protein